MHRHLHRAARALRDDRERHHRQPAAILLGAIAARSFPIARAIPAALGIFLLGGCGLFIETPGPEGSDALISVLVTGDVPDEELSLEIGGSAWTVAGGNPGSAALSVPDPQEVRLVRIGDCEELAAFDAEPGTAHAVVFAAGGSVSVEDRTEEQDAGAPLERRDPADCA